MSTTKTCENCASVMASTVAAIHEAAVDAEAAINDAIAKDDELVRLRQEYQAEMEERDRALTDLLRRAEIPEQHRELLVREAAQLGLLCDRT